MSAMDVERKDMRKTVYMVLLVLVLISMPAAFNFQSTKALVGISANVDVYSDVLNLVSKGTWLSVYIELPEGYDVNNISVSTVMLNDTVSANASMVIGDYDNDTIPDAMVLFDRSEVITFIAGQNITFGNVILTVSGELKDGTAFVGSDEVGVSSLMGDVNCDGKVDILDIIGASLSYGLEEGEAGWNANANFAPPYNKVDLMDVVTIAAHYGESIS